MGLSLRTSLNSQGLEEIYHYYHRLLYLNSKYVNKDKHIHFLRISFILNRKMDKTRSPTRYWWIDWWLAKPPPLPGTLAHTRRDLWLSKKKGLCFVKWEKSCCELKLNFSYWNFRKSIKDSWKPEIKHLNLCLQNPWKIFVHPNWRATGLLHFPFAVFRFR